MTQIFKFGGASVKNAAAITNLLEIVKQHLEEELIIVISAMGKTTSRLEQLAIDYWKGGDSMDEVNRIIREHDQIAKELRIRELSAYENLKEEFLLNLTEKGNDRGAYLDKIMSYGELFSTVIIEAFLRPLISTKWLDARKIIKTSSHFGEAIIDWEKTGQNIFDLSKTEPAMKIGLTQGFIGSDSQNRTTTLGKEGSDFTAAIMASCLGAQSVTVWKDVAGIMNADPKLMSDCESFPQLSYQEITEMTYYGAKVIHRKTMVPLAKKGIPLYVKSFLEPDHKGTLIHQYEKQGAKVPTYVFKFNQMVITLRVRDHSFMDELKMMSIFHVLNQFNVKLNLMQNSALTFTICIHENDAKLKHIVDHLSDQFVVTYNRGLHLATVINYNEKAILALPDIREKILEQKSRSVYQVLYHPL